MAELDAEKQRAEARRLEEEERQKEANRKEIARLEAERAAQTQPPARPTTPAEKATARLQAESELTKEHKLPLQQTEGRNMRSRIIAAVTVLVAASLLIFIPLYFKKTSAANTAASASASATGTQPAPTATVISKPMPPLATATATATAAPSPTPTAPTPSTETCNKVTDEWIKSRSWAKGRSAASLKLEALHKPDRSIWTELDCGPGDNRAKWVYVDTFDITQCCMR